MADSKISALTTKATPTTSDLTNILDAAAANADKKITLGSLPVSTAQQSAIDAKVEDTIVDGVTTKAPSQNAVFDALALKQDSLGFTAENVANKDTDGTLAANSDTKYASQKATKTYADTKAPLTGATFTGNISVVKSSGNADITLDAAAATDAKDVSFKTGGLHRFVIRVDAAADNLNLRRYDDAGAFVDSPIQITRSTGAVQIDGCTFSTNSAAPNATIPVETISATNAATDVDLCLKVKGNGAILAQVPDGTNTGGDKRGTNAVDLQMLRSASAQVASGANSFAAGARNSPSAQYAVAMGFSNAASQQGAVSLGQSNNSSGTSAVSLGHGNSAAGNYTLATGVQSSTGTAIGRHSHSSGMLATAGDSQYSMWDLKRSTTDATATPLSLGGAAPASTSRVTLPNNTAYAFTGVIVGKQSGSSNCVAWKFEGLIVRGANAASTAIVGTPTITAIDNTAAWGTPTLAADTTNGALTVSVVGAAATNIRWTCTLRTTEITYA